MGSHLLIALLSSVGQQAFYEQALACLGAKVQCKRRLVVKYSPLAVPEFLVNQSLSAAAMELYLSRLYRQDPLLRLVCGGEVPPVTTFAAQRSCNQYAAFFKSSGIFDELVLFLRAPGGTFIAFCFDRAKRLVTTQEQLALQRMAPLIAHLHALHCRILYLEHRHSIKNAIEAMLSRFCADYALSRRERQIVEKTMLGYCTQGIAEKLQLSTGTVKNYKHRLYQKLDITGEREIFSLFMAYLLGHLAFDDWPANKVLHGLSIANWHK